jgi:hypothetical protein
MRYVRRCYSRFQACSDTRLEPERLRVCWSEGRAERRSWLMQLVTVSEKNEQRTVSTQSYVVNSRPSPVWCNQCE